jgi:hypothetical protein
MQSQQPLQPSSENSKKKKKAKKSKEEEIEETVLVHNDEDDNEDWNVVQKHKKHTPRPMTSTATNGGQQTSYHHERRPTSMSPPLAQHKNNILVSTSPIQRHREVNVVTTSQKAPIGWSNIVAKDSQSNILVKDSQHTEKLTVTSSKPKTNGIPISQIGSQENNNKRKLQEYITNNEWSSVSSASSISSRYDSDFEDGHMDDLIMNIVGGTDDEDLSKYELSAEQFYGNTFGNNLANKSDLLSDQYVPRNSQRFVPVIGYELFGALQPMPNFMNIVGPFTSQEEEEEKVAPSSLPLPHINPSDPFNQLPSVTSQAFSFGSIL